MHQAQLKVSSLLGRDYADKHWLYGACAELILNTLCSVSPSLSDHRKLPCLSADADRPMSHHLFAFPIFEKNEFCT
jgi:hypothetical protein